MPSSTDLEDTWAQRLSALSPPAEELNNPIDTQMAARWTALAPNKEPNSIDQHNPDPTDTSDQDELWLGEDLESSNSRVVLPSTASLPPPGASRRLRDAFSPIDITVFLPHSIERSREEEEALIAKMREELATEEADTRETERLEERIRRLSGDDTDGSADEAAWLGPPPDELQFPPLHDSKS